MLVDKVQNNGPLFNAKIKEKEKSAEEFQATLNEIKEGQKQEQKATSKKDKSPVSEDLDLSVLQNDSSLYAWQKLRESQHKKNEETMLNNLFSMIDANTTSR